MHCLLFVARAFLILLSAAVVRADELDQTIESLLAKRKIPGLSLAIIDGGAIVRAQGYGLTARANGTPVTPDTLFQAGSISKPVAALAALQLAAERKIGLDDDINRTLRSWQVPENAFTKTEKVTLRRLLSHTAGLTVHGFPGYREGAAWPTLIQVLNGERPANTPAIRVDTTPGQAWRYSGGGYTAVQQWMIDVAEGGFPSHMKSAVLDPLGMRASTYEQPLPKRLEARAAHGHTYHRSVLGRWHGYPEMAAAGLWTTPSDLARFAIALQQAGTTNSPVSAAIAQSMLTLEKGGYGLGLALQGEGEAARFSHSGRDEGFDALLVAYKGGGKGAVLMVNTNDPWDVIAKVAAVIAQKYNWPGYPRSAPAAAIEDAQPATSTRLLSFYNAAYAGKVQRELLAPAVAQQIAVRIEDGWFDDLKDYGRAQRLELLSYKAGTREYSHRIITDKETLLLRTRFGEDGKITSLRLAPE
jgi:CubicO group peptidase (beta-lactamase class C family)